MAEQSPQNPASNTQDNSALVTVGQNIVIAINRLTDKTEFSVDGLQEATINASSSGDNTIIAAQTGKIIRVYRMWFIVTAAVTITLKNGSSGLTGAMNFPSAGEGFFLDLTVDPWFTCDTNSAFIMTLGGAVQVSGRAYYTAT